MTRSTASAKLKQKPGLEPVILFGLLGALLFFIVSGATAYVDLQTLRKDNERLFQSGEVIITLGELLSSAQDAETGQRGFLLTNNEKYLEPYNAALDSVPLHVSELAQLTRDNPAQQVYVPGLVLHLNAKLAELKQTIDLRRTQGAAAALAIVNTDAGKIEMDAIRAQIADMDQVEDNLRASRLVEMTQALNAATTSGILSGILGIVLTAVVGFLIRRTNLARQRDEWLQSGQVSLAGATLGDQPSEALGQNILSNLAEYLGAVAGAIYVGSKNNYQLMAQYGVPAGVDVPKSFCVDDGLLGQAVRENHPLTINDVPDGYIAFGSALGRAKPRYLIIWPAGVDGVVNTVIELGFIRPVGPNAVALLTQTAASIATAIRSAAYRAELQELLEDTQRKSEELQVQGEELRVSNEELEEQSRALKESQSRLEQQQIELEQTNSQLEEQAGQLELQRDDLEQASAIAQLRARELEQASRYKTDFLANMSHELRTPLNSSLILAKLLVDNPDDNLTAEQVKYAQTIQSSGNDLLNLINDILDLSKIEAGHVEIRPELVSLEQLSLNIRQVFQPVAQSKGLEFSIVIAAEAPATITTDPQRLEQILKNLLSNAFKFTEKGKVELEIAAMAQQRIAIRVTDTGVGISEDQQRSVFEAFHQADSTISRRYGGTGLGLSISRELARLLGGSIELSSKLHQGSTFTVIIPETYMPAMVLPREAPALRERPIVPAPIAVNGVASVAVHRLNDDRAVLSGGKRVLLIIEDDETFAGILFGLSHEMGFESLVASTAAEALALARQHLPNAIILDIGLPDQSGLSVLDQLKRDVQTRHIPIHVVSGNDQSQTAMALGAVGYMVKPVKREELAEVLKKLEERLSQRVHRVLIVEDDQVQREAVGNLLRSPDVEIVTAGTAVECLAQLKENTFDCMVLDLSLPDASGYSLLEMLSHEEAYSFPPVIVYTGRDLSPADELRLRRYSKSIIVKGAKSPERLLDEVTLFLHQVVADLPDEQQKMIRKARNRDAILEGRRILIVEDDVRNVYALTNILEPRGALVEIARNGREALEVLEKFRANDALAIDLVLMDIMMPVMDGLTATREIRKHPDWSKLPIITLTAKAMPDDQQRCIEAGASDYMAKPLDVEKLLSLVRVWMPR
jgi:signal transduction histidine kinase/DNA-binding response OmpR family regulator/CHASE3 domain sensor protein